MFQSSIILDPCRVYHELVEVDDYGIETRKVLGDWIIKVHMIIISSTSVSPCSVLWMVEFSCRCGICKTVFY